MKINKKEFMEYIRLGYQNNLVKIIYADPEKDNGCAGIACQIGNPCLPCFCFAGAKGKRYGNIYDYIRDTDEEENIRDITDAIFSMAIETKYDKDELDFNITATSYYHYLKDKLKNKYEALQLWNELEDVPVDEEEKLDVDWRQFPKETHREDIWHWFEETYNVSVAKDLMGM